MVGARTDVELRTQINFDDREWQERALELATCTGSLMSVSSDYFVYQRGTYVDVPPLIIGRPGFDNWLLWCARAQRIPLVDATADLLAIHQVHLSKTCERSPERDQNRRLAGRWAVTYCLSDSDYRLGKGRLRKIRYRHYRHRCGVLRGFVRSYVSSWGWLRAILRKAPLQGQKI